MRLRWENVLAWRLARQGLAERARPDSWPNVVARICGLHAQVMSSAELTLWARVSDLARDAVQVALWEQRSLVKTWAMRGTLHLLPAEELPMYVAALSRLKPRHHVLAWLRHHGLSREQADAMLSAIPEALDGAALTREELARAVARATGEEALEGKLSGGFGDLLKPAAFAGDLCFAPSEGPRVRFTRPDRWLPGWHPAEPHAAAAEIVRRYLAAYGPASREQFQRWFGMRSPAEAGRWLRDLGDEVTEVDVEGYRGWMLGADVDAVQSAVPGGFVRLLPGFDHYVVAAPREVEAILPSTVRERVYRPQGWLSPVLLVNGRIAGVWSHRAAGGRLTVEIEPFARISAQERRTAEGEAERLAAFLDSELELTWT